MRQITQAEIDTIAACGFDVYAPIGSRRTWIVYSDGENVAYMQRDYYSDALDTSTMHIGNHICGTGFQMDRGIALTRENLARAFCFAPDWASRRDREAIRKWPSVAAWLASQQIIKYELIANGVR